MLRRLSKWSGLFRHKSAPLSLATDLDARIRAKVESGLYNNPDEVIREALFFMDTYEEWIYETKVAQLRQQQKSATPRFNSSECLSIQSQDSLTNLYADNRG